MRIGTLDIKLEGRVWQARVETPAGDHMSGFGETMDAAIDALRTTINLDRIMAWSAFCAGMDWKEGTSTTEAFETWWSTR